MIIYKTGWRKLYTRVTDGTWSNIIINSLLSFVFPLTSNGDRVGTCICMSRNATYSIIRTFCKSNGTATYGDIINSRRVCQPVVDVARLN